MSRSGYTDDGNPWLWMKAVENAIKGRRGQAFLREMLDALDGLRDKRLITGDFIQSDGQVCALGAVGVRRGIDVIDLDSGDQQGLARAFGIAKAMVAEIMYENDECGRWEQTPEERWSRMRAWVAEQLREGGK